MNFGLALQVAAWRDRSGRWQGPGCDGYAHEFQHGMAMRGTAGQGPSGHGMARQSKDAATAQCGTNFSVRHAGAGRGSARPCGAGQAQGRDWTTRTLFNPKPKPRLRRAKRMMQDHEQDR